jgi:hypothetical protein
MVRQPWRRVSHRAHPPKQGFAQCIIINLRFKHIGFKNISQRKHFIRISSAHALISCGVSNAVAGVAI